MALFNCKNLSALARICPNSPSVSSLSRAVAAFRGNRFMRRLRQSILRRYKGKLNPEDFCYAVDDTANPKYGKGVHSVGNWHSSSGPFHGQKILVVVLVDRKQGFAVPISYAFGKKNTESDYISMPMAARNLLAECLAEGYPPLPFTCDSWFDSAPLMLALEAMGLSYDGEIKSTRVARSNSGLYVPRRKLAAVFADLPRQSIYAQINERPGRKKRRGPKARKFMAEAVILINGVRHPVKAIAVYNKRDDKQAFAFYASTNRSMSGAKLWALARSRWAIECVFRDLKQNLSFGRLPCTGQGAADLAVCLPFAILVSLRLDHPDVWGLKAQSFESIGVKLAKIREASLSNSLAIIASNQRHPVLERLRARRRPDRVCRKPVNMPAAKPKAAQA